MTTTEIKNIHNLKHFNIINQLLNIENLEVFATKINELLEQIEIMKNVINDYEQERQYLMDMIAEMKGYDNNIYVFEKEEEYNTFSIPAQQEEKENKQAEIINIFREKTQQEEKENKQAEIINIFREKTQQEEKHIKTEEEILQENKYYSVHSLNEEQKEIDKKLEEQPSPLPELFSSLKDYINNFSKYDKEHKKAVKKAIVEDFKKAGFKVKANNGYYYGLNIIFEVNKKDILDNQDLSYLAEKATNNFNKYEWENTRSIDYLLNAKENVCSVNNLSIIKEWLLNRINYNNYSRYSLVNYNKSKKRPEELFYKDDVIEHILETAQKILNKYSFITYYDPYADYNTVEYTINYDFIIKLID